MATLTEIRNGIKARLATIEGLTAYAIEPAAPKYPAAWTFPLRANYHADFPDGTTWTIAVTVAVAAAEIGHAQTNLDPYLAPDGAKSIVAALEGGPLTVATVRVADSVRVVGLTNYFANDIAGGRVVGAQFEVEVFA